MTEIHSCSYYCDRPECIKAQRDELRERLAQPEQDVPEASCANMGPVGWLESPDGAFRANPLYKIQFPSSLLSWQVPLYTSPPQRKPLTDKAITQVIDSMPKKMKGFMVDWDLYEFARAIEAAHGIKGEA